MPPRQLSFLNKTDHATIFACHQFKGRTSSVRLADRSAISSHAPIGKKNLADKKEDHFSSPPSIRGPLSSSLCKLLAGESRRKLRSSLRTPAQRQRKLAFPEVRACR
jgi:hypothetical protein